MTTARFEHLFNLARVCHVPPPAVDELTIADFGLLTLALNDPDGS